MQPARFAAGVALVLPDRHAFLHFVDDVAAGREGGVTMRSTDTNPHRQIADFQRADAMDAARLYDRELPHRLGDDALAFRLGQGGVGLISQVWYGTTIVRGRVRVLERDAGAGIGRRKIAALGGDVDRRITQLKACLMVAGSPAR